MNSKTESSTLSVASIASTVRIGIKEARGASKVLLSFALSLILGVSAMVAARGLAATLEQGIATQSKGLLGADILLRAREPIPDGVISQIRSEVAALTTEIRFRTMAVNPEGGSQIVQLSAIDGEYPFYGDFETVPPNGWQKLQDSPNKAVVVHSSLASKLQISSGTELTIGSYPAKVEAVIVKMPGDTSLGYAFAPRVFMRASDLPKEDLLSRGALADYYLYLKLDPAQNPESLLNEIAALLKENRIESETAAERQQRLGEVSNNIASYFSLIGTVALLLGTLTALVSLQFYLRQKRSVVAVLKCVGASQRQILLIFGLQVAFLGATASTIGAVLGGLIVPALPTLIEQFTPFALNPLLPVREMGLGVVIGALPLLCLLIPALRELSFLSPVEVLRPQELTSQPRRYYWISSTYAAAVAIALTIFGTGQLLRGALMGLGVVAAFVLVALFAMAARALLKSARLASFPLVIRYAVSNIYRPGNQSLLLLICFGLGSTLLALTLITETMLSNQTKLAISSNRTNVYLFDVQLDQLQPLQEALDSSGFELTESVPTVLMRLVRVGTQTVQELLSDPDQKIPKWTLNREYWSTYRSHQTEGERLVQGGWVERVTAGESVIPVSIEDRLADRLQVTLGSELEFDVSGIPLVAKITSIRDILWERLERNSFLVFPEGAFDNAPRFFVLSLVTDSPEATTRLSKLVGELAPNVSVLDVRSVVDTIQGILGQMGLVIKILAGIILLLALTMVFGVLIAGRSEREKEGQLLRVLGARSGFITQVSVVEYVVLAVVGASVGVALGILSAIPLALFVFKTPYTVPVFELLLLPLAAGVVVACVCVGLEVVRKKVG